MRRAAPDAATQLVQLRQAEPLRMLNDHDVGLRHIHAHSIHGGGDQNARFARTNRAIASSFSAPFICPCSKPTCAPKNALQVSKTLLRRSHIELFRFRHERTHPIDLRAGLERAADTINNLANPLRSMVRVVMGCRPAGFSRRIESSISPK